MMEAEPLTSVVRTMMAMTSQAIPSRAIGYFVTCSMSVDEVVAPARRLGPGDGLAPSLLLALLLLQALLLQPLQALDALDGGRPFLQRGAVRSSSHLGGVLHTETKIAAGRRSLRFLVSSLLAEVRFHLT